MREFWCTVWRPSTQKSEREVVAVPERKPVYADSPEEAKKLVEKMPVVLIGGKSYPPTFIESL